jgi:prepilin-type N-terminal cleavage/methylation domain-containing protein
MVQAKYNSRSSSSRGFSLVEVLVSMGLLTVVSLGVAQLFAVSARANYVAKGQTSTTALAEQKLEQLRALTWGFDADGQGLPVSDTSTNLATDPASSTGGGLNPSPSDSLASSQTGYVDYLDGNGQYVGTGTPIPGAAVYVRRWSVQPLPTNPNNTLILQVFVSPVSNEQVRQQGGGSGPLRRMPGDALLVSVKTRKAQ